MKLNEYIEHAVKKIIENRISLDHNVEHCIFAIEKSLLDLHQKLFDSTDPLFN